MQIAPPPPIAYTQEGAARALSVDVKTLRRWEEAGIVRPRVIGGRKLYAADMLRAVAMPEDEPEAAANGNADQ